MVKVDTARMGEEGYEKYPRAAEDINRDAKSIILTTSYDSTDQESSLFTKVTTVTALWPHAVVTIACTMASYQQSYQAT